MTTVVLTLLALVLIFENLGLILCLLVWLALAVVFLPAAIAMPIPFAILALMWAFEKEETTND